MKKISSKVASWAGRWLLVVSLACVNTAFADDDSKVLRFDVLQDLSTFNIISPDGAPPFAFVEGSAFVIQGYIYPAGTLQSGIVPIMTPRQPPFPDKVLGTWSCRGWFVADGAPGVIGIQLVGTQVWVFNERAHPRKFGRKTIITDGIDLSANPEDFNVVFKRAITGGTGPYSGASGVQISKNLGYDVPDPFMATSFGATHKLIIEDDD